MRINLLHRHTALLNYSPGRWEWSSPERAFYNLWICLEGDGEITYLDRKIDVFPGMGLLLPQEGLVKGQKHRPELLSNVGMHFMPCSQEDELTLYTHSGVSVQFRNFTLIRELVRYLDFLLFRVSSDQQEEQNQIGETLLSIFLRDAKMGPEGKVDRLIRNQAEEMRARPERTRSGEELAAAVGLSCSQFSRRFYKMFKLSPRDFLLAQRVEKAGTLLRESQMTVGEIAESLGYRDVGYFSRQFKQKTGRSPLAYRKRVLHRE
ncbi:AraC family transcriptional regulator [Kiritimatiellota bacterium B12222]|nr:AraC family transcriptional regulator [Kiritimatiellota bacterium B12222]